MIKKLKGMTILETMLALAISATIVLFAVKQYTVYKRGRDVELLEYRVDTIFQAMRDYYHANCASKTLAPTDNYTPPNPFVITISGDLAAYIESNWKLANPIIDISFGDAGYAVQFNNVTLPLTKRQQNFCYYFPGQSDVSCDAQDNNKGIVYLWVAQVVVKIRDTAMTLAYKGFTNADCAIASFSPGSIVDCSVSGMNSGSPHYLVWQHLPSFASPAMSSSLWSATPYVKEFNWQYTHDELWELVSTDYTGSNYSRYYLCGG